MGFVQKHERGSGTASPSQDRTLVSARRLAAAVSRAGWVVGPSRSGLRTCHPRRLAKRQRQAARRGLRAVPPRSSTVAVGAAAGLGAPGWSGGVIPWPPWFVPECRCVRCLRFESSARTTAFLRELRAPYARSRSLSRGDFAPRRVQADRMPDCRRDVGRRFPQPAGSDSLATDLESP